MSISRQLAKQVAVHPALVVREQELFASFFQFGEVRIAHGNLARIFGSWDAIHFLASGNPCHLCTALPECKSPWSPEGRFRSSVRVPCRGTPSV